jgi:predicted nucleic acid-binding protein
LGGGRAYDAVIAACARQARADVLLTFNARYFDPSPKGVIVVEPARSA